MEKISFEKNNTVVRVDAYVICVSLYSNKTTKAGHFHTEKNAICRQSRGRKLQLNAESVYVLSGPSIHVVNA